MGARVSQDVKCFTLGHRVMSVPISAMSRRAVYGPMESICVRSAPERRWRGLRISKRGSFLVRCRGPRRCKHVLGRRVLGRQIPQQGFDRLIAVADLTLIAIVEIEVLPQGKHMFWPVVPGQ